MKTWIIILLILIFLGLGSAKVYADTKKLRFEFDGLKLAGKNPVVSALTSQSIDVLLKLNVKNFGKTSFTIKRLLCDLYTEDGQTLIASQVDMLNEVKILGEKSENPLSITYNFTPSGILALWKAKNGDQKADLKTAVKSLVKTFTDYQTSGYFGLKVRLKGSFDAYGVIPITIDEVMTL